jgi:catechol 2,3-dioxygenase-like lactoylglutathione lyase family enzyme
MAVGVFAGIPVGNYDKALDWYKRLLGAEPAFYPNDIEKHGPVRKYVFHDEDGNETGIGGEVSTPD